MNRARQLAAAGLLAIAVAFGFARYGYGLFVPEFRNAFGHAHLDYRRPTLADLRGLFGEALLAATPRA